MPLQWLLYMRLLSASRCSLWTSGRDNAPCALPSVPEFHEAPSLSEDELAKIEMSAQSAQESAEAELSNIGRRAQSAQDELLAKFD